MDAFPTKFSACKANKIFAMAAHDMADTTMAPSAVITTKTLSPKMILLAYLIVKFLNLCILLENCDDRRFIGRSLRLVLALKLT
jgi:hypothetical protein